MTRPVSVLSVLSVFSVFSVFSASCAKKDPPKAPSVPVTVGTAEQRAVPYELAATGMVEPIQTVAVQPQVSGPIMRVAFREGQDVRKGQVLFELDARPFQAALKQAEGLLARDHATASNAAEQAKRYSTLAEKEYVTAEQNDAARSDAAAATATATASQAAVDQARLNLQYATIRAPISGRTGGLRVREGNLVRSTDTAPLVTINQIQPILVRFAVPASNLGAIQRYRNDRITVFASPTGGGTASQGTLAFVDNAVDTTTGTILLKGSFPNADGGLWPGEFVNVRLRLYVEQSALVVPASAVVSGQQGSFVFVIQPDSSAATRKVAVERTAGDVSIVTGEVKPGDRVVTDGQLRLRQGSKVQIKLRADSARAGTS
jgi:membrane fusion protein, multidrug efflux system